MKGSGELYDDGVSLERLGRKSCFFPFDCNKAWEVVGSCRDEKGESDFFVIRCTVTTSFFLFLELTSSL